MHKMGHQSWLHRYTYMVILYIATSMLSMWSEVNCVLHNKNNSKYYHQHSKDIHPGIFQDDLTKNVIVINTIYIGSPMSQ